MPRGKSYPIGAETVNKNGYTQVKTKDGWIGKHILIMEEYIGRKLKPGEFVRFVNGDRTDLRLNNLILKNRQNSSKEQYKGYLQDQIDKYEARLEQLRRELKELDNN